MEEKKKKEEGRGEKGKEGFVTCSDCGREVYANACYYCHDCDKPFVCELCAENHSGHSLIR